MNIEELVEQIKIILKGLKKLDLTTKKTDVDSVRNSLIQLTTKYNDLKKELKLLTDIKKVAEADLILLKDYIANDKQLTIFD